MDSALVDYFSSPNRSYEQAETLDELRGGLNVVRTLVRIGRDAAAVDAYSGELARGLLYNVEAFPEILSLLRPFFPNGWGVIPSGLNPMSLATSQTTRRSR